MRQERSLFHTPKLLEARLCEEGIPLLIIHSKDDEAVPFEHAERIRQACPEAAFWKVEGYRHVGAYAHPRYRERLLNFLRTLEAKESTQELWRCHERSHWPV